MSSTIDFYNRNAKMFAERTEDLEFTDIQDRFLSYLPNGGRILDFGCGAGRDTRYFLSRGFHVTAIDGSESLCEVASRNTGITVRHMLFSDLDAGDTFDGIWACASILHLPREELADVFQKMINAVKPGGFLYVSFKYGTFEGYRHERYFTDFTEDSFQKFLEEFPTVSLTEEWISADVRPGRGEEKWLNAIIKKSEIV